MNIMTPGQHRAEVRRLCQIGQQPTARQIRRAYFRYLTRDLHNWALGAGHPWLAGICENALTRDSARHA